MTPKPLHCRRVAFGRLCAGLALAAWTAQQEGCGDTYFNFQQRSNPQGIFADQNTYPPAGSAVHTIVAPLSGSGYNFAYWTVNGVIATDIVGQARTRVDFAILQDTTAIATYLPPGADTNADGVADYLQWFYFGALTNGPTSDTDGDGFTLSDELSRGYNPVIRDEIADGGVMMRVSDTSTYHDQSALKYYEIRSDPQGIVTVQSGYAPTGTNVITPSIPYGASSGYYFGYWEVNGVRQAGATGMALSRVVLPMTNDTVAIARFFSAGDSDGDTLDDWREMYWFGNLDQCLTNDPDADGFTIADELARGYAPNVPDDLADGGVMMRVSDTATYHDQTALKYYAIRSDPQGIVTDQSGYVLTGTNVTTPSISYGATSGYYFGYWEVNGVRQAGATGMALSRVVLPMTNDTVAIARFFSAGDSDGDTLDDWREMYWFGNLNQSLTNDPDADGFTIADELARGYAPNVPDDLVDGGIMMRVSDTATYHDQTALKYYTIRSDPQGIVSDQSGYVLTGTNVVTPSIPYGASSGYYFGYWEVNGVRQAGATGLALSRVTLPMTNDTVAIARFFSSGDSDGDTLDDWREMYWFGNLSQSPTNDPDGDGFTIADELARGYSPIVRDELADGGIMIRLSDVAIVNLSFFPKVSEILVNGRPIAAFATAGGTTGLISLAANSAPALGDWNGDGDLDLVVGGANGQLRAFRNDGSPCVPDLVEETSAWAPFSALWTNLVNVAPALGDWTGDGHADLALGGSTNRIVLVSSIGDFTNATAPRIVTSLVVSNTATAIPALAPPQGSALADLFVLRDNGTVDRYPNTGIPTQPFAASNAVLNILGTTVAGATGLAVADVNEDGIADVLVSDTNGVIWEFRGTTNGTYAARGGGFAGLPSGFAHRLTITAGDLDGDGDTDLLAGEAEGGLFYLRNSSPRLLLSPPTVTLQTGQSTAFAALNVAGPIQWSLARNASGGSITTNGVYAAGPAEGLDAIQGVSVAGLRGRSYANVIAASDAASFGKAVIVAGGRNTNDPVWAATRTIADEAYNVLRYKGFSRDTIRYHSFLTGRDVDGNGLDDDLFGNSAATNVAATFTNWVANASRLFVCLVDHGDNDNGNAYFRLNAGECLSATQLGMWLDAYQDRTHADVTVLLDFCYSGSFLPALSYTGTAHRVVIASAGSGQVTYFLSGGLVSFSDLFLSAIFEGMSVGEAYLFAGSGMSPYQQAQLDDTGDGVSDANDGAVAGQIQIGATHVAGKDVPLIGGVAPNQTLTTGTRATLWAGAIESYYPLKRVWGNILPPSYLAATNNGVPVTALPEVDLSYDSATDRYSTEYDGFTEAGGYRIQYYAEDIWGSVSAPRAGLVTQNGFDERLLLVAAAPANPAAWGPISNLATMAYQTALARRIPQTRIRCLATFPQDLDNDGTNDVAATPSLAALGGAITNWAAGAGKLTLYLMGGVSNSNFRLNAVECLTPTQLETWCNAFQVSNAALIVVLDWDGAGRYIGSLNAPPGAERITIAATKAGASSLRTAGGTISFSQFFLSGLFEGESVGTAFDAARNAISVAGSHTAQTPQLDDTGNGIPDEKNKDGVLAAKRYFGGAFVTGADTPYLAEIGADPAAATVWVADLFDVAGISNVWCTITPPGYDGTSDLTPTSLVWNASADRYEAPYAFSQPGLYACTFMALNNDGLRSRPRQLEVANPDAYEPDDAPAQARCVSFGETQLHTLHSASDEDWGLFLATTNDSYTIAISNVSAGLDVTLEVYRLETNGVMTLWDLEDDGGPGEGESSLLNSPPAGLYGVRVYAQPAATGGYDLTVTSSLSDSNGLLVTAVNLATGGPVPAGVRAHLSTSEEAPFSGYTARFAVESDGVYTVTLTGLPAGWACLTPGASQATTANGRPQFLLAPTIQAQGLVRDAWTGERLGAAVMQWMATSGMFAGQTTTVFAADDGALPVTSWIAVNWQVTLMQPGYVNGCYAVGTATLTPGATTNVGTWWLTPVDLNSNGIADAWEAMHFGTGASIDPTSDADHDGLNNLAEYRAGTDPRDAQSTLTFTQVKMGPMGLTLRWPVVPGRVYQVMTLPLSELRQPLPGWQRLGGPWTADAWVAEMQWSDPAAPTSQPSRVYRIELLPP